jgi:hypothetical protein
MTPRTSLQAKVDWLLAHPGLWVGWNDKLSRYDDNNRQKRMIVELMKRDGLVHPTTYWHDCGVWKWIREARRQRQLTEKEKSNVKLKLDSQGLGRRRRALSYL